MNTFFSKFKISHVYRMFGFKPVIIQVLDNITNAKNKQIMIMEILRLHTTFYENVDFDDLFMNRLDRLLTVDNYEEFGSYLEISAQVVTDYGITEDMLRQVLINWIYSEPFFKKQIINETPTAEAELSAPPIAYASFV